MRQRVGSLLWRSLGVLLALVVLFQVAFLLYFRDFYGSAEKAFWVPGLSGEFVPQGMDRLQGGFVLSGYLSGSGAARLYLVEADGSARLIRLRTKSGQTLISHAGGVAVSGSFVYLAGGNGQCYVFAMEDVLDPRQTAISVVGSFRTGNRASFCCMWGQSLLVGEYAYGQRYRTADSHHLTTPAGDRNTALVTVFPVDSEAPLGVAGGRLLHPGADPGYELFRRRQGDPLRVQRLWGVTDVSLRLRRRTGGSAGDRVDR
mgnify:CR=1 FL=1